MKINSPKIIIYTLIFLSIFMGLRAAERIVDVNASVDHTEVGLLDVFRLTVTIDTENVKSLPKPELPELEFFSVLNESTGSRTSISIINGKTTRSKEVTYTYTIKPEKKGTFTIEPVSIVYRGDVYRTEPITVTVVGGHALPDEDVYMLDDGTPVDVEQLKRDIFILAVPESSVIYEGEQLLLTYKLYSRVDIDTISLKSSPDFSGFYKEDIFNATKLENKRETYRGQLYTTTLLKKVVLFPIKPGRFSLEPLVLEATVIIKNKDLFDVFGMPFSFDIKSNDVTVTAKPLPESKSKPEFSQVVGELSVEITGREKSVNVGESTTCYLIFKSTGNLNTIDDPKISLENRGRVYLSGTKTDRVEQEDVVYFIKKFEYTIIPEINGLLAISSKDFLYYDTETSSFKVVKVEPFKMNITGKSIIEEKAIKGMKKVYGEGGLNFIKGNIKKLSSVSLSPLSEPYYYIYHIVLVLWLGIIFIVKFKKEKLTKDTELFKKISARHTARDILNKAHDNIKQDKYREAIDLIFLALTTYIAYKCGKNPQEITIKNAGHFIENCFTLDGTVKEDLLDIMEKCTLYKFSSERIDDEDLIFNLHKRTVSSIDVMERK